MIALPSSIRLFVGITVIAVVAEFLLVVVTPAAADFWLSWASLILGTVVSATFLWLIAWRRSEAARIIFIALTGVGVVVVTLAAVFTDFREELFKDIWSVLSLMLSLGSTVPLLTADARRWCVDRSQEYTGV